MLSPPKRLDLTDLLLRHTIPIQSLPLVTEKAITAASAFQQEKLTTEKCKYGRTAVITATDLTRHNTNRTPLLPNLLQQCTQQIQSKNLENKRQQNWINGYCGIILFTSPTQVLILRKVGL